MNHPSTRLRKCKPIKLIYSVPHLAFPWSNSAAYQGKAIRALQEGDSCSFIVLILIVFIK